MNEKFAHTAGPWTVGTSSVNGVHCVDAIDPHRPGIIEICEVWGTFTDTVKDYMSLANAHLISASPELLEAIQPFIAHNSSDETITITVKTADIKRARAAVAKALGKTSEAA